MTTVEDAGCSYLVAFPDGTGTNPVTPLVNNPSCPGIADDYRAYLRISRNPSVLAFDLAYHAESFDLAGQRARAASEGAQAWVDPDGYARWGTAQIAMERRSGILQGVQAPDDSCSSRPSAGP